MKKEETRTRDRELLDGVRAIVGQRFAEVGLSLDDVAEELDVPTRTLQRALRDCGISWREILAAKRMRHAETLIMAGRPGIKVQTIAPLCGYKSVAHFAKAFRRFHGKNPGDVIANG